MAAQQHGVVSIRQLTGPLGYSKSGVARATESGHIHRLHHGVYAVGHTDLSRHGRCLAAVLAAGPNALLSHRSAGWLWGWRFSPAPYEVTTPIPRRRKLPVVVHYSRCLEAADRALVDRVPVSAVPRTLLDLAATVPPGRLDRCIERAEELRLFDFVEVDSLLRRTIGHPGRGRLRHALAVYREPAFTRSGLERRLLGFLRADGIELPATGFNVAGHELDLYWPEHRLAVEVDTYGTHGTHAAFERDRKRDAELRAVGIEVERVTGTRIENELRAVLGQIRAALARTDPRMAARSIVRG